MVFIHVCFGYEETSFRLFSLTKLHIYYGLATRFAPIWIFTSSCTKPLKPKVKVETKLCISFVRSHNYTSFIPLMFIGPCIIVIVE